MTELIVFLKRLMEATKMVNTKNNNNMEKKNDQEDERRYIW